MEDKIETWITLRENKAKYRRDEETLEIIALLRIYRQVNTDCVYDLSLDMGCPQCMKNNEFMGMNRAAEQKALELIG